MRRVILLACAALGAAGSLPAQSVTARVGGEPTAVGYYQTVTVPITVDMSASGGLLLGSYTARLTWNPSVLSLNAYTCCGQTDSTMQGNFPAPAINTDSAYSFGILKFSAVSPTGVGGLVTIAQLRFTNYDTIPTPLQLSFSEMSAAGTFTNLLPILTVQNATFCQARGRWGDLDGDGNANSRDALFILTKVVGLPVNPLIADTSLADVDADGRTTSRDALVILSYAVGIPVPGQRVLLPVADAACATGSARQVAVLPNAVELVVNQVFRFTVQATDSAGRAVSVSGATWRSSDFSIAAVEADGTVTPRAAGTATITAEIGPGVTASATVTVIARRPNWYVDIAATGRPVQNGSATYPYEHPLSAFPWVGEGDTVRVASGTYYFDDDGELNAGVVLLGGTPGDTTTRPVFRNAQGYYSGLWLRGGQRTVVRNVVFHNFSEGIELDGVRNLAVEDTKFLTGQYGDGIYHCGAEMDTVRIDRSVFLGDSATRGGTAVYYSGCPNISAHVTIFRDSRVQFMDDGLYLYGADSLLVLRSQFLDVYDNGIYLSQEYNERPALVVSQSQFLRGYYQAIEVNYMRRVVVDSSTISSQTYYPAIDVYDADTILVRGTSFPGDSVSGSPYSCYSGQTVYVYRARRTELRDNVLTNAYCTGIQVEHADRVGRVVLSHNRIDGAAAYGIRASAPVIALDHNVVRNIGTPVNFAAVSTGVYIHSYYGVDSLTSLGDSVINIDYIGFNVDSARVARIDSLYVNGTGLDSTAFDAHGVVLSKGRLDITHSRVINAGWDGITATGPRAVLRSRGNVVRGSRGGGLGTWPWYWVGPGPDSLFSVRDTVQRAIGSSGIWAGLTSYALIDSAVIDTVPAYDGVYLESVGRALVRDSRVRAGRYGIVVSPGVGRVDLLRDSVLESGSGDGINITLSDASVSDSAIIRGTTVEGVAGFAGVYFQGAGRVLIDSSRFSNAVDGIEFSAANLGAVSARITRSRISSNRVYGVGLGAPGSQVSLSLWKNNIFANGVAGVVNYAATPPTVDADSNYWGDFNGPRCQPVIGCSGLSITGDSIVTQNVVFAPWDSVLNPAAPLAPPGFVASAGGVPSAVASSSFATERPAPRTAMRGARPDALRPGVAASPVVSPPPRRYGPALPAAAPIAQGATPEQQARIERNWQRRVEQLARRAEVEARQRAERENVAPQSPRN